MLILVGVTINIAIDGGLFSTAKEAVKQTEIEAYREKIDAIRINLLPEQIAEGLEGKKYIDRIEEAIRKDNNFERSTIKRKDDKTLIVITKEGYEFEITEEETKYIGKGNVITDYPKVGDYVNYTPQNTTTSYNFEAKYSGNSSNQTINQETLKWRILNINDDGTIDLISDETTSTTITFKGALGYNNEVYLLNDFCNTLYSNSKYDAPARSLNIEDIR